MTRPTRCNSQDELDELLLSLQELNLSKSISFRTNYMQAHGGFCDVFMGYSSKHGEMRVAVKRLRIHILHNRDVSKMIFRELKIWSTLKHPNVLPLLGYVMHDKYPCSVSQWMVNGTVRKCLDNSVALDILEMARGIAAGLLHLHQKGVIHSDLKCDNVFVSDEGHPLLADFGISRVMSASTTLTFGSSCTAGSARWMAKELLMVAWDDPNSGKHSKATDVWAFGMVVYELATGLLPYPDLRNDLQVSMAIISDQFPRRPPSDNNVCQHFMWSICEMCWVTMPSDRPDMDLICSVLSENPWNQIYTPPRRSPSTLEIDTLGSKNRCKWIT
ncbi:kinase-like protein [Schizopora paradoxa]|uniref:Kinase-like protein n=1 Tax=Schizopora paradoxa TaxID=27342 RepID=A0A0H2RA15_9AGAM|nr:kinase-like protein [Schizopora paradoxa]